MTKKLTIHLVTWNGAKYVPYLFESLRKQTYRD
ncbi:MAG: glycosyltransferase family 2 protein, partial [Candidatus Magasanikbacteria bacterium]|nr:glycosyltransferase family 2 protein [Candidatus Magasanikbacteria bacterium]